MKTKFIEILLAGIVLASACQSLPPLRPDTMTAVVARRASTPQADATSTTSSPATPIGLATHELSGSRLSHECLQSALIDQEARSLSGTLIINDYTASDTGYLLDLSTLRETHQGTFGFTAIASPDHTKVAYISDSQLEIRDARWQQLASFPIESAWRLDRWLDNDQLLIEVMQYLPQHEPYAPPQLLAFSTTTGNEAAVFDPSQFPDFRNIYDPFFDFSSPTRMTPDSGLSLMAYAAFGQADEIPVVLWDLAQRREITRLYNVGPFGGTPVWSPDQSELTLAAPIRFATDHGTFDNLPDEASVGGSELLGVGRTGLTRRLTYITTTSVAAPSAPTWSPDGRHIAYWLSVLNDAEFAGERLAVVDTQTGIVTNYCLNGYLNRGDGESLPPVWSPDGKWLAVTVPDAQSPRQTNVVLIDLERKVVSRIADHAQVRGWLIEIP